jgi:branched-subunit amino acid ABC-type transport system permease component
VLALVLAGLHLTPLGLRVRAVAADSGLAESVGIRSGWLNLTVFSGSAALAGLAGALVAPLGNVQPDMGVDYLFGAFLCVIVAGSRTGAVIVAALAIAVVQNMTTFFSDPVLGRLAALVLAFGVLHARRGASLAQVRP